MNDRIRPSLRQGGAKPCCKSSACPLESEVAHSGQMWPFLECWLSGVRSDSSKETKDLDFNGRSLQDYMLVTKP